MTDLPIPADTEAQYLRYLQLCEQRDEHPCSIAEFVNLYAQYAADPEGAVAHLRYMLGDNDD